MAESHNVNNSLDARVARIESWLKLAPLASVPTKPETTEPIKKEEPYFWNGMRRLERGELIKKGDWCLGQLGLGIVPDDEAGEVCRPGRYWRREENFTETATTCEIETPVEPVIPAADAQAGEGSRLRTERVTLEVTYRWMTPPSAWNWNHIITSPLVTLKPGESVRVVEESESSDRRHRWGRDGERCLKCNDKDWMGGPCNTTDEDYIEKLTAERDAAISERDTLRAERITQDLTADRFAAAVAEADRLRARVAELESSAPAASEDSISNSQPISGAGKSAGEEMSRSGQFAPSEAATEQKCPERESVTERRLVAARGGGNVTPAAKGWLTEKERETVEWLAQLDQPQYLDGTRKHARVAQALLARSSPPEVVRPNEKHYHHITCASRDAYWLAALAAAGVAWKEVGK